MKNYITIFIIAFGAIAIIYFLRKNDYSKKEVPNTMQISSSHDLYEHVIWRLLDEKITDTTLVHSLNNFMNTMNKDTLLVFRFNIPNCTPCLEYLFELGNNYQKSFGNVIILSNFSNRKMAAMLGKEHSNTLPVLNVKNIPFPLEKVSREYVFLYTRDGIASHFFIPEESNMAYNEKMINKILKK